MSDIFDEVEEDLRRERFKKLWDRFAPVLIGAALLVVFGLGGWRVYQHLQAQRQAESGDRFNAAMQLAEKGQHEDAAAAFTALSSDGTAGYRTLGRLRAAAEMSLRDPRAAIAAFDAFAGDASEPSGLRDIARLRAGYLLVDHGTYAEAEQRVGGLAEPGNPLRHSAREILGLAAWKAGDNAQARKWLQPLVADAEAPAGFRQRSDLVLDLIASGEAPPPPPAPAVPAVVAPAPMPELAPAPATPLVPAPQAEVPTLAPLPSPLPAPGELPSLSMPAPALPGGDPAPGSDAPPPQSSGIGGESAPAPAMPEAPAQ